MQFEKTKKEAPQDGAQSMLFDSILTYFVAHGKTRQYNHPRYGRSFSTNCIYHNDESPSLHVHEMGFFKCFGCGRVGSLLSLALDLNLEKPQSISFNKIPQQLYNDAIAYVKARLKLQTDQEALHAMRLFNIRPGFYESNNERIFGLWIDLFNGSWTFRSITGKTFRNQPGPWKLPGFAYLLSMLDTTTVVLTEGVFDALTINYIIKAYEIAYNDKSNYVALCTQGNAAQPEKVLQFLKEHGVSKLILAFDNDDEGRRYTETYSIQALKNGFTVEIVTIPEPCKDINELYVKDTSAFETAFENRISYFEYYITQHSDELTTDDGKKAVAVKLQSFANLTQDPVTHSQFEQTIRKYGLQDFLGYLAVTHSPITGRRIMTPPEFEIIGDEVYAAKKIDNEEVLIPVGPAVRVTAALVDEDNKTVRYEIEYAGIRRADIDITREEIRAFTQSPILEPKLFDLYLRSELISARARGKKLVVRRTGWFGERFVFFNDPDPDLFFDVSRDVSSRFVTREERKQLEFIRKTLKRGDTLALLFVCAFAAPVLKKLGITGFTVLLVGPRGVGKTTAATLAVNSFYDATHKFTMDATDTAIERIAYTFSDLPILLDEIALSKNEEEIERLIFKIESGSTRARSNKTLEVRQQELRNVLFTTNEFDVSLQRSGAERRRLLLYLHQTPHLEEDVQELRRCVGGGRAIVKHLARHPSIVTRALELYTGATHYYQYALYAALDLLEDFFDEDFDETRAALQKWLDEQASRLGDYYEKKLSELREYIARHRGRFYVINRTDGADVNEQVERELRKSDVMGIVVYDSDVADVLFFTTAFSEVLRALKIASEPFKQFLKDAGILYTNHSADNFYFQIKSKQHKLIEYFQLDKFAPSTNLFYRLQFNKQELIAYEEDNDDEVPF